MYKLNIAVHRYEIKAYKKDKDFSLCLEALVQCELKADIVYKSTYSSSLSPERKRDDLLDFLIKD